MWDFCVVNNRKEGFKHTHITCMYHCITQKMNTRAWLQKPTLFWGTLKFSLCKTNSLKCRSLNPGKLNSMLSRWRHFRNKMWTFQILYHLNYFANLLRRVMLTLCSWMIFVTTRCYCLIKFLKMPRPGDGGYQASGQAGGGIRGCSGWLTSARSHLSLRAK